MALGGVVELLYGVKAEKAELEDIAPLTAVHAEEGGDRRPDEEAAAEPSPQRRGRDLGAEDSAHRREQARRYRLGPGRTSYSPGMAVSAPITEVEFSREVKRIEDALTEHGPTERRELAQLVGARFWGRAGSRPRCARRCSPAARGGWAARASGPPTVRAANPTPRRRRRSPRTSPPTR